MCHRPEASRAAAYLSAGGTAVCPKVSLPQQFSYSTAASITHVWSRPSATAVTRVGGGAAARVAALVDRVESRDSILLDFMFAFYLVFVTNSSIGFKIKSFIESSSTIEFIGFK